MAKNISNKKRVRLKLKSNIKQNKIKQKEIIKQYRAKELNIAEYTTKKYELEDELFRLKEEKRK